MTSRHPLPDAAESLLVGWPVPPRSALEWEDLASRTVRAARDAARERAADPAQAANDDALFAAPLPLEEGEGSVLPDDLASRSEPEEPGLLSIAKKAVATDAGASLKEIALAGLQAADAERRDAPVAGAPPRPPTRAEQGAQAVAGLMGRMPAPARAQGAEAVSRVAAVRTAHLPVEAAAHSEVPTAGAARSKKPWAAVTVGGVALSLAAAFALFVGSQRTQPELTAASQATDPPAGAAPTEAHATPVAPAAIASQGEPEPQAAQPAQLEALPAAESRLKDDALAFRVGKSASASNQIVLERKPAPVAKAPIASKSRALNDEMAQAVGEPAGAKTAPPRPVPQVAQESLPDRPSIGDAQAAAGPALMKARMCLAGQETGSQAKLTFGSDGRVKNVAISGPAAGTPAESCLRSQLSTARVPPFAEASFSFSLTVRPP